MAEWHLKELREALERLGWRFVAEHDGDGYRISATWEFVRDDDESIMIDFDGLDELNTLPIEESYGCKLRTERRVGLYFSRKGDKLSSSRTRWRQELDNFVRSIGNNA